MYGMIPLTRQEEEGAGPSRRLINSPDANLPPVGQLTPRKSNARAGIGSDFAPIEQHRNTAILILSKLVAFAVGDNDR